MTTQWTRCHHHQEGTDKSHRDFRVRRAVVLCALQCFIANTKYYCNVCINPDPLAMLPEDGDLSGLHSVTLGNTWLHWWRRWIVIYTGWRWRSLQHVPFWLLCPQYNSADDWTGDSETICARVTILPAISSSTYNVLASQGFNSHQRVQYGNE